MTAYYNEINPYAAQWLRNLIAAGYIADGDVDERDIKDVTADDLVGYDQCHFFAGIGGLSYALRLAGWPDERPVWTGSCPCQPFSAAGRKKGMHDDRHLWPVWFGLIRECRPVTVFGEQVEAAINHGWLDLVQDDMEGEGYAVGSVGLPAACVGAPHIRQRLWFVADATQTFDREPGQGAGSESKTGRFGFSGKLAHSDDERPQGRCGSQCPCQCAAGTDGVDDGVDDTAIPGREERRTVETGNGRDTAREQSERFLQAGSMGDAPCERCEKTGIYGARPAKRSACASAGTGNADQSPWSGADWIYCRDQRWRPVESGIVPLAHGISGRVGALQAYGNAIVPQVAAEVIRAYMETKK